MSAACAPSERVDDVAAWNAEEWFPYGVVPVMVFAAATRASQCARFSRRPKLEWERVPRVFPGFSAVPTEVKGPADRMLPLSKKFSSGVSFESARNRPATLVQTDGREFCSGVASAFWVRKSEIR